jgi:hypothetical protein
MANKNKESLEGNRDGKIFFWGIMISIIGSMMVTAFFEVANSVFSNRVEAIKGFYIVFFILSSIFFWQISKIALISIGVKKGLRMFDGVTVAFAVMGLVAFVLMLIGNF